MCGFMDVVYMFQVYICKEKKKLANTKKTFGKEREVGGVVTYTFNIHILYTERMGGRKTKKAKIVSVKVR